jgi:hypothetical protein
MQHTKKKLGEVLEKKWKIKDMHKKYIWNRDGQLISEENTFLLLMERPKSRN